MALLSGNTNCIRYVLFGFNFLFVITGIILISVGATVGAVYNKYELFLVTKFFSIPTFLIVIGSFIFVIAFFGCCGAMKENYCMILTFSVLLALIFIFELAAGISGYVLRADASELISNRLGETMSKYSASGSEDITSLWDYIQKKFGCCGVYNYAEWKNTTSSKGQIPLSCCTIPNGVSEYKCTDEVENTNLHRKGCLSYFGDYISAHAVSLGAAGIVLAVVQFAGVFFACYISREIRIRNGGSTGMF